MRLARRLVLVPLVLVVVSCAPAMPPPPASPPPPAASQPPPQAPPVSPPIGSEPLKPEPVEPWITVGHAWDLDSLSLAPGVASVLSRSLDGSDSRELAAGEAIRIARKGGSAEVWSDGRSILRFAAGDTVWLAARSGGDGPGIRWKGKSWRGQFKVFFNPRGKLTVASRMALESYLVGVLPGEIGPLADDLFEAGRAQAIAARSYTLFYRGRRAEEGFDLYGTVEDQVYGSIEAERPLATRCVESTRARAALSGGQPIRANYYSTCGGVIAEVWEGWPTPPLPYLVSHLDRLEGRDFCSASPHYRWREEWSAQEFLSTLRRFAPQFGVTLPRGGLGRLVDVRVVSRSRSARVWRLEVVTTAGRIEIPAHRLRQVIRRPGNPNSILRSTLFKVDVRRDRSGEARAVIISGAGNGHGVGLCQTGALGMARAGLRGEQIIEHYYRGVEIARVD